MYLTLENIKNNVCERSTKSFEKVKDLVNGTTEKLSLQQVLQIIDTPEVSTRDLIYQMRSFAGENVKQFFVEFTILRAERVLHMYEAAYPENLCARNAIQAAKNWIDNPTEATAAAAADATAAAYAAAADAAADADAAAAYAAAAANAAANAAAAAAAYAAAADAADAAADADAAYADAADAAYASARRDLRKLVIEYYDTDRRNNKRRNAVCQGIRRRVLDQWVEKHTCPGSGLDIKIVSDDEILKEEKKRTFYVPVSEENLVRLIQTRDLEKTAGITKVTYDGDNVQLEIQVDVKFLDRVKKGILEILKGGEVKA